MILDLVPKAYVEKKYKVDEKVFTQAYSVGYTEIIDNSIRFENENTSCLMLKKKPWEFNVQEPFGNLDNYEKGWHIFHLNHVSNYDNFKQQFKSQYIQRLHMYQIVLNKMKKKVQKLENKGKNYIQLIDEYELQNQSRRKLKEKEEKQLKADEKLIADYIKKWKDQHNLSYSFIAKKLQLPYMIVVNLYRKKFRYGYSQDKQQKYSQELINLIQQKVDEDFQKRKITVYSIQKFLEKHQITMKWKSIWQILSKYLNMSWRKMYKTGTDPNDLPYLLKQEKQRIFTANMLLEIYERDYIVVVQDEAIVKQDHCQMYSWCKKNQPNEIFFGKDRYDYQSYAIYALCTSEGKMLYFITEAGFNQYTYQYFIQEAIKVLQQHYYQKDMSRIVFYVDQAKFHSFSLKIRDFYRNYKLKVLDAPVKTPQISPIEFLFNKWKSQTHRTYYSKQEDFLDAIHSSARSISKKDILQCFRHAFKNIEQFLEKNKSYENDE